jgi:hypothetical protein
MLIDHTEARSRTIGSINLIPGINKIDDKRWDNLTSKGSKWAKPIMGLIESGILKVEDARKKLTIAMVEKTYDVPLLEDWKADPAHKGPLRGAITKQLKAMEIEEAI